MDPIKIQKLQAMNQYKKNQFLNNLILNFLTTLTCAIFCSSPFWFLSLCSSMKSFLFVSLPNIGSSIFNPKCLFIVCNVIIVFLVGQSKLVGCSSSPAANIYDEYVKMSQSLRRHSTIEEKKQDRKLEMSLIEESVERVQEDEEEKGEEELEEEKKEREEEVDGEEELGLPADELNKRVEDFIARVKRQRMIEAKQLLGCSA